MNPYIADILDQPSALRNLVNNYALHALENVLDQLGHDQFKRIIITGMGASFNAAYPAVIQLSCHSVPVQFLNAAELLHYMDGVIEPQSLLWMNSQSGRSAELVHLLDHIKGRQPACILTFVNDISSPLASRADVYLNIHAGSEATVGTKTYINMLAANLLAAVQMTGGDMDGAIRDLLVAVEAMERYLSNWAEHVDQLDALLGDFGNLFLLGRGTSMSAIWNGSLINMESARSVFDGMNSADFRHGPLELVSPGFAAFIFAGSARTAGLNRNLGLEIVSHGGRVLWVDKVADPDLTSVILPETSEFARPLLEILPLQMLTLVMARRKGLQAGVFRHVGKVTDRE